MVAAAVVGSEVFELSSSGPPAAPASAAPPRLPVHVSPLVTTSARTVAVLVVGERDTRGRNRGLVSGRAVDRFLAVSVVVVDLVVAVRP